MHQVEMARLNDLVPYTHSYRRFSELWTFEFANQQLKKLEKDSPYKGYSRLRLFN